MIYAKVLKIRYTPNSIYLILKIYSTVLEKLFPFLKNQFIILKFASLKTTLRSVQKNRKDKGQQITQVQNKFSEKSFLITNFIEWRYRNLQREY